MYSKISRTSQRSIHAELHPTLDLLVTGGRDAVARVWDMRTKHEIMSLGGHKNTVSSLIAQGAEPQIVTGSMDSTIRSWDLRKGNATLTLTHQEGCSSHVYTSEGVHDGQCICR